MLAQPTGEGASGVTAAEVERQVNAIAASSGFANATALRSLLLFFARRTLMGDESGAPPKEQEIATEVLGRSDDFDSRTDSSVRSLVGRLRSKLAEYYMGSGAQDPLLIEISKGSYSLVARPRVRENPPLPPPAPPETARRRFPLLAIASCLVCAAAGLTGGFWISRTGQPAMGEEQRRFWKPFLESPKSILVVLGTPRFATIGDSWVVRSPRFLNSWPAEPLNPELHKLELALNATARPVYTYVAAGEVLAAFSLTRELEVLRARMRYVRSAQFQWDELRSQNVIFLGAPKMNPPTQDLPIPEELTAEPGEIRNLKPAPGEQAAYGITRLPGGGAVTEGHVLVTRFSRAGLLGELLVIGSPVSEGSWAAADYLSSPDSLRILRARVAGPGGDYPAAFQVVLRYRLKADVPIEVTYVTHHILRAVLQAR